MELWRADPQDVIRLPVSCYPRLVVVTEVTIGPKVGLQWLEWTTSKAYGRIALPDSLEVDLLFTERADKRVFLADEVQARLDPATADTTTPTVPMVSDADLAGLAQQLTTTGEG